MKHLTLIIALLWALGASGQIYIDSFTFGAAPAPQNPLLDDYPGAARAYSLRLLRTAYTGNCVRVRRVSDGTTSDIGFSAGYLDTTALKTFCASTDCFVNIWYDQSTAAANATQSTLANQPQIAAGGALIYSDGEATIQFNIGVTSHVLTTSTVTVESIFSVAKVDVNTNNNTIFGSSVNYVRQAGNSNFIAVLSGGVTITSSIGDLNEHLIGAHINATTDELFVDGTSKATGTIATFTGTLICRSGASNLFRGKIKELVIYSSDQLANNSGIQSNINSFYQTY